MRAWDAVNREVKQHSEALLRAAAKSDEFFRVLEGTSEP